MGEDGSGKRWGIGETVDVHVRFTGDIFSEYFIDVGVCLASVDLKVSIALTENVLTRGLLSEIASLSCRTRIFC